MLFRAVFWMCVVALLMPNWSGTGSAPLATNSRPEVATATAGDLRGFLLDRLEAVRADIEAAEQSRAAASG